MHSLNVNFEGGGLSKGFLAISAHMWTHLLMHNSIVAPKRGHTGKKPFTFIAVVDYSILKEKETFVLQGGN